MRQDSKGLTAVWNPTDNHPCPTMRAKGCAHQGHSAIEFASQSHRGQRHHGENPMLHQNQTVCQADGQAGSLQKGPQSEGADAPRTERAEAYVKIMPAPYIEQIKLYKRSEPISDPSD